MLPKKIMKGVAATVLTTLSLATVIAEPQDERDARMAWWREAKFGLFIHWGVYAVPAGTYQDKQIDGIGEWIMLRGKIPVAEYRAYAKQFNPVKYDPEAWVELARDAGMKYIVITSKHHDGFALWDSQVTGWDIADATPYGRDLLTPLADAARRADLKFGLYYSQAQDWTHPGGAKSGHDDEDGWDDAHKGSFDDYLLEIAIPQTCEILRKFQPDILWWDTPRLMTPERAAPLHALLAFRPGIISNNRLGGDFPGDTETPEQHIPATGFKDRDWEVCMTMNDTWGFKSYDHNWKSTQDILRKLSDIVSKGGNFLLNVGPTAEGEIPQPSIDRLREVGAWMKINSEAVYGTSASPFPNLPWGRCSRKFADGVTRLYLHVFDWPSDGQIPVTGLRNEVVSARLLAGGAELSAAAGPDGVTVTVPSEAPDPNVSVVVLDVRGEVETLPFIVTPLPDGVIELRPDAAEISGGIRAHGFLRVNFERWTDPKDAAQWTVRTDKGGDYRIDFEAGAINATAIALSAGASRNEISIPATGDVTRYKPVQGGTLTLPAGQQIVRLEAITEGWSPPNIRAISLTPVAKPE